MFYRMISSFGFSCWGQMAVFLAARLLDETAGAALNGNTARLALVSLEDKSERQRLSVDTHSLYMYILIYVYVYS